VIDRIGQQFGNYRLTRLLGQGGFADVYLGEHLHLKSLVAIKILHTRLVARDQEAFLREARTIADLEHPSIVRVLDCGIEHSVPFLIMNYAPYGTLRQRHPKGSPAPLNDVITYVEQLAGALQYAHDRKLIHRDVKPENMLVGRHQELLLSDFGIALFATSSTSQSTKATAGTALYMAPEQIMGKPRASSDQYALAMAAYEWLSGMHPFRGTFSEVCAQHLYAPMPPLRQQNPTITLEVENAVLKALAKEPQYRFPSIQDFATALKHYGRPANPVSIDSAVSSQGVSSVSPRPSLQAAILKHSDDAATVLMTPSEGVAAFKAPGHDAAMTNSGAFSAKKPFPPLSSQRRLVTATQNLRTMRIIIVASLLLLAALLFFLLSSLMPARSKEPSTLSSPPVYSYSLTATKRLSSPASSQGSQSNQVESPPTAGNRGSSVNTTPAGNQSLSVNASPSGNQSSSVNTTPTANQNTQANTSGANSQNQTPQSTPTLQPASTPTTASTSSLTPSPTVMQNACIDGYVYRLATPYDNVCVTPDQQAQVVSDNQLASQRVNPDGSCISGYVFRMATYNDHVCVTPEEHVRVIDDNRNANAHKKYPGG